MASRLISILLTSFAALASAQVTTVAELARQADDEPDGVAGTIRGRIVARGPTMLTIDDGTGFAAAPWFDDGLAAGDVCETIFSHAVRVDNASTNLLVGRLYSPRKIGATAVPPPTPATLPRLTDGSLNYRAVTVAGVVSDVTTDEVDPQWTRFTLESEGQRMTVTFRNGNDAPPVDPVQWIDAAVEVTGYYQNGLAVRASGRVRSPGLISRKNIGGCIICSGTDAIRPLVTLTPDSFRFPHRTSVSGTVIATWDGSSLFLRTADNQSLRVHLLHNEPLPAVGSTVTLAGFRRANDFFEWLSNASTILSQRASRPSGASSLGQRASRPSGAPSLGQRASRPSGAPSLGQRASRPLGASHPGVAAIEDIPAFRKGANGRRAINPGADGRIVRLEGRVRDVLRTESGDNRLLLDADGTRVMVEAGQLPVPTPGSRIAVTGACLVSFAPNQDDFVHVRLTGVSVILRTADDLVVLVRPPWWTPGRLGVVIVVLLAALVAFFVKNRLVKARAELRVKERNRLAIDLHDTLSQNLTGVSFQLESFRCAQGNRSAAEDAAHHLETAERILASTRVELRRCLWDLRNDVLADGDFADAVRTVLEPIRGSAEIRVSLDVPRQKLGDDTAHAVLRIIRELASNAIRHGRAAHVRVDGEFADGELKFSVADDGAGFDPARHPGPEDGHFGLMGIRERARALKGSLDIRSTPGRGTVATIRLPLS